MHTWVLYYCISPCYSFFYDQEVRQKPTAFKTRDNRQRVFPLPFSTCIPDLNRNGAELKPIT
uniref:Putative ovule protein n=1 Tax=Solanum chacoense TaxID=4108 RepID=A0A0V0GNV6_SOLCH